MNPRTLFKCYHKRHVWCQNKIVYHRKAIVKHGGGSITLYSYFSSARTGVLFKIGRIMDTSIHQYILAQNLQASVTQLMIKKMSLGESVVGNNPVRPSKCF